MPRVLPFTLRMQQLNQRLAGASATFAGANGDICQPTEPENIR